MFKPFRKISPFLISVVAAVAITLAAIIFSFSSCGTKADFSCCVYFLYYSVKDNSPSADAVSENVYNLGGAGYVLNYNGNYYAAVSCYYKEKDAERVKRSLLKRGLECSILKAERKKYIIKSGGGRKELYTGNLNTLFSLSELCYKCANGLDDGQMGQTAAKTVLSDVEKSLNGLKSANPANCFTQQINGLSAECDAAKGGFVYSKSLRKLQIAILDVVLNIELY